MIVELILLVGLVLLWASNRRLANRLTEIERSLADGRHFLAPGDRPAPEALAGVDAEPVTDAPPPVRETLSGLFERLVGGRLLIWIGGIALAAGGIFLIRHSIELVTPEA